MSLFLDFLTEKTLPGFVLLKNTQLFLDSSEGYRIKSFDEAFWSDSIDELRSLIPPAKLLHNKEAHEHARFRFGESYLQLNDFRFDDLPDSLLNESSDMEVFGESWVIFWIVPMNKEFVINYLLEKLEKDAAEKIRSDQLKSTWNDHLNRLFFRHSGDEDIMDLVTLHDELTDEIIMKINLSAKSPDEDAWEILNEEDFFSDEE